jgi:hypothetical protein
VQPINISHERDGRRIQLTRQRHEHARLPRQPRGPQAERHAEARGLPGEQGAAGNDGDACFLQRAWRDGEAGECECLRVASMCYHVDFLYLGTTMSICRYADTLHIHHMVSACLRIGRTTEGELHATGSWSVAKPSAGR